MSTAPALPGGGHEAPAGSRPRIVVGVDGSAGGAEALTWALRQAVLLGADVDAVAVWQIPAMIGSAGAVGAYLDASLMDLTDPTREVLDKTVAAAAGEVAGAEDVTVRPVVVRGYATQALLAAAGGADLLVVGSRGHGELSGMLLGSVGLHCATHAPCPVVIVRSAQRGEVER